MALKPGGSDEGLAARRPHGGMQGKDPLDQPEESKEWQGDQVDDQRNGEEDEPGEADSWQPRTKRGGGRTVLVLFDVYFHERFTARLVRATAIGESYGLSTRRRS